MALIEIFRQPLRRRYSSTLFSKAFIVHWGFIIVALVISLVISFTTKGFYILDSFSVEDPLVYLLKPYVFASIGSDKGQYFYNTGDVRNAAYKNNFRTPLISFSQYDNNSDSLFDRFVINMEFPMDVNENVFSFQLFLAFNFQLRRLSRIQINDYAYFEYSGKTNAKSIEVTSNIEFRQRNSLNYKNYQLLQLPPIDPTNIDEVLTLLYNRSASVILTNKRVIWTVGRDGSDPFRVKMTIDVNPATLMYKPGFWFATKWAWIQFASIAIFAFYLQQRIQEFLFANRYIAATVTSDLSCHCGSIKKMQ